MDLVWSHSKYQVFLFFFFKGNVDDSSTLYPSLPPSFTFFFPVDVYNLSDMKIFQYVACIKWIWMIKGNTFYSALNKNIHTHTHTQKALKISTRNGNIYYK